MSNLDLAMSVALGIGLAAATGFRLFLPLLVLSITAYTGHVNLNESFAWLATPAAVIMLGTAAIVEIAAFYIPGVDNLLDTGATPGAVARDDRIRRCHDPPAADGEMDGGHYRRRWRCRHHTGFDRNAPGEIHRLHRRPWEFDSRTAGLGAPR